MVIVRATRKLLQRLGTPGTDDRVAAGLLGDWYATYLPWRPRQLTIPTRRFTMMSIEGRPF